MVDSNSKNCWQMLIFEIHVRKYIQGQMKPTWLFINLIEYFFLFNYLSKNKDIT